MTLVNIGFGNLVSLERAVGIISPDSAPVKRVIQESRERGMLIDATYGRKTASVWIMDSGHVILSAMPPEHFTDAGNAASPAPDAGEKTGRGRV